MNKLHKNKYSKLVREFHNGEFPNLRFGQAFCNVFHDFLKGKNTTQKDGVDIFYEEFNSKAAKFIEDNFVDWHPECR